MACRFSPILWLTSILCGKHLLTYKNLQFDEVHLTYFLLLLFYLCLWCHIQEIMVKSSVTECFLPSWRSCVSGVRSGFQMLIWSTASNPPELTLQAHLDHQRPLFSWWPSPFRHHSPVASASFLPFLAATSSWPWPLPAAVSAQMTVVLLKWPPHCCSEKQLWWYHNHPSGLCSESSVWFSKHWELGPSCSACPELLLPSLPLVPAMLLFSFSWPLSVLFPPPRMLFLSHHHLEVS